jgi:hypothetical protein
VTRVDLTGEYRLAVRLSDGTEQDVDLAPVVTGPNASLFGALRDHALFDRVHIDTFGSLRWPNGVGLDPWKLHDWPTAGPEWIARVQRIDRGRRRLHTVRIWLFAAAMVLFAWNLAAWFGVVDAGSHPRSQLLMSSVTLVIAAASLMQERWTRTLS